MNNAIKGFYPMVIFVMALAIATMRCNKNDTFPPDLSDDSSLRSLTMSGDGSWKPEFDPEVFDYIYTVADTVESITLTPKVNSKSAKITINGKEYRSHTTSSPVLLEFGNENNIVIQVTAENGYIQKYTVIVDRLSSGEMSDDNFLKSLALSGDGLWDREFNMQVSNYTYTVLDTVESITCIPEANSKFSQIKINEKECKGNEKSAPIPLIAGKNEIAIKVTAENGDIQEYTVIVMRLASGKKSEDNFLKSLSLSGDGSWNPEFKPNVSIYTYTVTNTVESITVTPGTTSKMSQITINGKKCISNEESSPIRLTVGATNEVVIQVEAENGDIRKYLVTVARLTPVLKSDDNSLNSMTLSGDGSWNREFNPQVLNYTYTVPNIVESITITSVSNSDKSKITINGKEYRNNEISTPIPLKVGKNNITIQVAAENGDVRQYAVIVARLAPEKKKDTNATLSSLTISGVSLHPSFNPENPTYTAFVPEAKVSLDVNATAQSPKATIIFKLDGGEVKNQHNINFTGYTATLAAEITAGDGSTKRIYTVVITRSVDPSKSSVSLRDIEITFGQKSSKRPIYHSFNEPTKTTFDSAIINYAAVVYACESITLTATAQDSAVASIVFNSDTDGTHKGGVKTGNIELTAGTGKVTKVTISVTGRDGSTVKKYNLDVKLLNADEFFWGIYIPSFNKSYNRWMEVILGSGLKTDVTIKGYASGTLHWLVKAIGLSARINMNLSDYSDGNDDRGSTPVYTPYNDNCGINIQDGFVINGLTAGDVSMLGEGLQSGGLQLSTPWGDPIGSMDIHYIIKNLRIAVDKDSYCKFSYMGENYLYNYAEEGDVPYPFTPDYDWYKPWKMNKK